MQNQAPRNRAVDMAVAHIERHLTQRITLSDLERVSHTSARVLQYAFMKKFGCSPMDWIKHSRLELARSELLKPNAEKSITQIALECGFHTPSKFSAIYKKIYGELPSETLKRPPIPATMRGESLSHLVLPLLRS